MSSACMHMLQACNDGKDHGPAIIEYKIRVERTQTETCMT